MVTFYTCKFLSQKVKVCTYPFKKNCFTKKKLQNTILVSLLIRSEKGPRHLSNNNAKKIIGVSQIQAQVNAESFSVKAANINCNNMVSQQLWRINQQDLIIVCPQ